uniref:G-protein coupled receptors family 1 profile domain-containing protein n=1 Tax=Equus asinus asinus TaxID=83772 RepID=A0A8C4LZ05_EQUAS
MEPGLLRPAPVSEVIVLHYNYTGKLHGARYQPGAGLRADAAVCLAVCALIVLENLAVLVVLGRHPRFHAPMFLLLGSLTLSDLLAGAAYAANILLSGAPAAGPGTGDRCAAGAGASGCLRPRGGPGGRGRVLSFCWTARPAGWRGGHASRAGGPGGTLRGRPGDPGAVGGSLCALGAAVERPRRGHFLPPPGLGGGSDGACAVPHLPLRGGKCPGPRGHR